MFGSTKYFMILSLAITPVAAANLPENSHSVRVRTSDIDLTSLQGKKVLALRIDRAGRVLCDFASKNLGHQVRKMERKCRVEAKANAWVLVKNNQRLGSR